MKKLLLVFAYLACGLLFNLNPLLHAETVNVTTEGTLSAQLTAAGIDATTVTSLTITGNINSTDLTTLKTMSTSNNLEVIDLSEATISGNAIPDYAFQGFLKLTAFAISNSVTTIGKNAFTNCTQLTTVTIPNSVTTIGAGAFSHCIGLTTVTIPNSVTTLGNSAFYFCTGLTSVTIPSSVTTIGNSVFFYCTALTSVTIPNSVTTIETSAFSYCTGLTSVTIPNSVTTIGTSAFSYCTELTSVTIPNSVTTIGNYAFYNCTGLTTVTIPNSVTSIGSSAFNSCTGLTTVTIPNSVKTIGGSAFYNCSSNLVVNEFCSNAASITLGSVVFNSPAGSKTLHVPAGSATAYITKGWGSYFTIVEDLPASGILSLTPANVSFPCLEGSLANVSITSNEIWGGKISSGTAWLNATPPSSSGNILAITATANTSITARTATITVATYDGVASQTISVTQAGAVLPTLTTKSSTNITTATAIANGNITDLGSPAPTAFGICYSSTNTIPTIADSKTDEGAATTTGAFTSQLTSLSPNTLYYACAYATNTAGTSYGSVVSFKTMPLPVAPSVGDGSAGNPYQITTLSDLYWLSQTTSEWSKNFIQTANIDASETSTWFGGLGFSPIGNGTTKFTGSYNGQGHTISGMFISRYPDSYVALFGLVSGATIQKLGVTGTKIEGEQRVGGIVGLSQNNTIIRECFSSFSNLKGEFMVGGIAGENNNSSIIHAYTFTSVNAYQYGGGITGFNQSGGIINFAYTAANVAVGGGGGGALVGILYDPSPVSNSFWNSDVMANGVFPTGSTSFNASPLTTAQMKVQSNFSNWDFAGETTNGTSDIWAITPTINNGYPCFTWQLSKPAVTTQAAIDITTSGATGRGNLSALGTTGYYPTAYGICYSSTHTIPTIADSKTDEGAAPATGAFSVPLAGLTPNTLYYARAYASNAAGISYGEVVMFNTLQNKPVITYPSASYSFNSGTAITSIVPNNAGGAVPATIPCEVSTFAGSGTAGYADGTGNIAIFNGPLGAATDAAGNVFVADVWNNKIRKITPDGIVTTLAGSTAGYADGQDSNAKFHTPTGVALDASGMVYVSDLNNAKIRKIVPDGTVTTVAGSTIGDSDGPGNSAQFDSPISAATDQNDNIYVVDQYVKKIRKIAPDGTVTTLAGSTAGYADGPGNSAQFNDPFGVTTDMAGNVYVADVGNDRIRKIAPDGTVTTIAGSIPGYLDGTLGTALFNGPGSVAIDAGGNIYIGDAGNSRVRKILPDGTVTTLAGSTAGDADGIGTSAQFEIKGGIALDAYGNLYFDDFSNNKIRKITLCGYTISPALPAGLNFDAKIGTISGTPVSASAATTYTITGSNTGGVSTTTITITVNTLPAVTTQGANNITTNTATGNGNITDLGSPNPTAYGICYSSTNTTPTISDSKTNKGAATATGAFTSELTGLVPNTNYYARAYATNAAGTSYGSVVTFTTAYLGVTSVTVPANGTYGIGQNLDFTVNFTGNIFVDQTGGTPRIAITIGGTIQYANYVSGSGTLALVFRYTVASGDGDTNGIAVGGLSANGGSLKDVGGNNANQTLYGVGSTTWVLVDAIAPSVSITAASTSTYGSVIPITITFSKSVTGFTAADITVTNATKSNFTGSGTTYTFDATPSSANMVTIAIPASIAIDAAGNDNTAAISINITVNKLKLTVNNPSLTLSKTYDGSTAAAVTAGTIINKVTGDDVTVTATASYNDATVATAKTITVVYSLSGTSAVNYSVPNNYVANTGEIKALKLTVNNPSLTLSKTYDGSTAASVTAGTVTDKVTGDDVTVTATASYNDATVASAKTITVVYSLSGTSAVNYSVPDNYVANTGEIKALKLTVSTSTLTLSKTYDGSTAASVTAGTITNKVTGDDVTMTATASYNDATVAITKTITVVYSLSGTSAVNYSAPDNYVVNTGEIKALKLTVNNPSLTLSKTYDGSTAASITAETITNKVTGDDVTMTATASYNDATVATSKTITVTYSISGLEASNYLVADDYAVTTGSITPAPLTIGITAKDKAYDGNIQASVTASITQGLVTGDDVTALASNGKFDNASVGNGKTVTADISIAGTDFSNYTFNPTATATASILDGTCPAVSFTATEVNGVIHKNAAIEVSFSEPVNMISSSLKEALVLRQENAIGVDVPFTATNFTAQGVSQFTITADFECGKSYYLAVKAGAFEDLSGNPVELAEKTFHTDPKPDSPVLSASAAALCPGSQISVTNYTGSLSYQWQIDGQPISGQTANKYVVEASGKYSVMAENPETGCQSSSDTISVNVYPVVTPVIYEKKDQDIVSLLIVDNSANTFISYLWTLADDSSLPSEMVNNRQFLTVTGTNMNNQYKVRITDKNGCQAQSEITQIKAATTSSLVYPTVNSGSFKIDLTHPETGKVTIRIMNQTGVVIKQYLFYKEQPSATFNVDMGHTVSGLYMVEIGLGNYRTVKSVVIE